MTLNLRDYMLTDDFYVVRIPDTNVVLGVQWLYSLGKYSTNYQTMEMEFQGQDGKRVVLRGMNTYPPKVVTAKKMEVVMRRDDMAQVAEFHIPGPRSEGGEPKSPREIQDLFPGHSVFGNVPSGRPPDRGFEHISEIEEGTRTGITTPYRHPRAYRDELEKHLQECGVCQRDEVEPTELAGSLQPLLTRDQEQEVRDRAVREYLVKWQGPHVEDATWEKKQVLQFPGLKLLEDKQIWAGRTVMSRFP